ncbi:tryptophan 7-halogenase [Chondromyces apiculatus]|uniref:FAD-binding protein n=1 Tax=Chondromyces apiculatus DSM 436 TaxID=1192034 RepID=A0A017SVQ6_9BACT|nr:tryptophan 7-halogenase [Chondromyces apiculatus]EYF01033.1 FAD-binding protein [Chondromyces apiculatus DSM 436]
MSHESVEESFDVIVLGGGPAGSTVSTFTAMAGHRVLLLEREHLPRHQIGESLLPATIHGICPMLGVKEEVERAGFPRKNGGTFRWGKSPTPWTFRFTKQPNDPYGYAYQVERAKFDDMLLRNAQRKGVDVREGHEVLGLLYEGERVVGVRFRDPGGKERTARARYVADTSGHKSHVAPTVGQRVFSKFFQNVALYGYYEHGKRLPAPNSGNILCAAFPSGWFWYIPLSDTLTSVGAVVAKESAGRIRESMDDAMRSYIDECPIIREYLAGATRVTEGIYGEYRIRKDYSYCNTRFWAPGVVLVGDAACFIDPVFSSGVHLATYSAMLAARSINTCLRGDELMDEEECFEEYEMRYRREFGKFYQFLTAFYDMNQDESSYFWSARKILNTEERDNDAFIRLVAGISEADEPLFEGGAERFFADRQGFGAYFGDVLAREASDGKEEEGLRPAGAPRPDPAKFDADKFMQGFTSEIAQLQVLALMRERRPAERPLVPHGLVASGDGLHWAVAPA